MRRGELTEMPAAELSRPMDDRVVAGVCAGLARYLGLNVRWVRVGYVLLSLISAGFPGTIVYLVLWAVMPNENR